MLARTAQLAALVCATGASTALAATAPTDPLEYGLVCNGNVALEKDSNFINFSIYGRGSVTGKKDCTYSGTTVVASYDEDDVLGIPMSVIASGDVEPTYALNADSIIDSLEDGSLAPGNITNVVVSTSLPSALVSGTAYIINGDVDISKNYLASDVVIAVRGNFRWSKNGGFLNSGAPGDFANAVICTGNVDFKKDSALYGAMLVTSGNLTIDKDATGVGAHIQVSGNAHIKKDAFTAMGSYELLDLDTGRLVDTPTSTGLFD